MFRLYTTIIRYVRMLCVLLSMQCLYLHVMSFAVTFLDATPCRVLCVSVLSMCGGFSRTHKYLLVTMYGRSLSQWDEMYMTEITKVVINIYEVVILSHFEYNYYRKEPICPRSRDSAVGIATGYGLYDRGVGVRVPVGWRIFLFCTSSNTGSGSTQFPIQWVKRPGLEADYSPPTSGSIHPLPHTPSWHSG
jgi:hypothetical protein